MIGTPPYAADWPSLNGPLAGTAFFVAVIGIALVANVGYAVTTPFVAGQPLEPLQRPLVAPLAFGLWTALGCLAVVAVRGLTGNPVIAPDGQAIRPVGVPEPGGVIFAATCAAWAAPYVTIASRRRRRAWLAVAVVAAATAILAAVTQSVNGADTAYDPAPPAWLILVLIAVGVWATVLYSGDMIPAPGRWARAVLGQAFFIAWLLIGLLGMLAGLAWSDDVEPGTRRPGAVLFVAACMFWTLPYLVLAARRRTPTWITVGIASIAIALFGIVYLFINPTPCVCD
jgi:hypothetical protein